MTNGSSTRPEDRKMYVPTLSELHRKHGRAKQFCSKTDCNGWRNGAQRRGGRMLLTYGGKSGNVPKTLETKPTSTPASRLLAMNGQMKWPKNEHAMTPSSPSCMTRIWELSAIISHIGSFILRAKGGERWPDVVTPAQGWDEKDERWKRATPILARPHVLRRRRRQWHCEACDKRASGGAQCHLLAQTGSFVWCCRCGARAAKFAKKLGEPCVGQPGSQEYARSIRLLSSGWHPKENRFLGSPKLFTAPACARWRQSCWGDNCDRAGLAELRQTVMRLRMAEAQPTNPDDKKHLLLRSGEVKWCWRCARRDCC